MKRTFLFSTLVCLAILLSACGGAAGSANSSFRTGGASARTLTPEAKLAIATIKLDTTRQAVDSVEAAKLLPLWQLLNQLNNSSTAAPQEATAVVDQIQSTMTPQQMSTINGMQITSADMFAVFQQLAQANGGTGAARPGGTGASSGTGRNRGGNGGGGGGQFFFAGGGGGGGGGIPGGGGGFTGANRTGTGTPTASQGSNSAQASQAAANRTSIILVSEVIRLLQSKIKS